ncbi:MAG: 3-hydroxybutyryl-CoA dehydrogenase [Chloroflexi bacterium]|nr:3-hydroxybutyryl-CoA dehydrogenase [Chloroflexota bacterium]
MDIQTIGVVGSGTMGSGIAQVAAQSGFNVLLYDINLKILQKAIGQIGHYVRRSAEKGRITEEEAEAALDRIATTTDLLDFKRCQFVIEAAPERIDLKKDLFHQLVTATPDDTILASNTSTLSITQIGGGTGRPGKVVGMHFFNPAPLLPLVEVVAGAQTDPAVVDTTFELAKQLGKRPIRVKDVPGFIVNRVARPFYLETLRLLEEGVADYRTLDKLIREGGGFPMGPFELMDLIGLDINYAASVSVYEAYFNDPRYRPSLLQQRKVQAGQLGRKSGRGWYIYDKDKSS